MYAALGGSRPFVNSQGMSNYLFHSIGSTDHAPYFADHAGLYGQHSRTR